MAWEEGWYLFPFEPIGLDPLPSSSVARCMKASWDALEAPWDVLEASWDALWVIPGVNFLPMEKTSLKAWFVQSSNASGPLMRWLSVGCSAEILRFSVPVQCRVFQRQKRLLTLKLLRCRCSSIGVHFHSPSTWPIASDSEVHSTKTSQIGNRSLHSVFSLSDRNSAFASKTRCVKSTHHSTHLCRSSPTHHF